MFQEINMVDVLPGQADAFAAAFIEVSARLRTVPGCRAVELLRCVETPDRFQVRVSWDRIEDHVEHYPMTETAAAIRAMLSPLIAGAQLAHYEVVPLH
ncbi:antibiotic biosynthesis monooxygenase family protein [Sphingomonas profundi]|uniref:antibiotic biosynthesis monooxygenase family protein n=1 Tax=Alterirhizorhabdus profundi TaxID=2681549 RepID=UPI0012E8955D|nr:antibiotic biosynthesis monooxygenase [Sphingomonas profundi]